MDEQTKAWLLQYRKDGHSLNQCKRAYLERTGKPIGKATVFRLFKKHNVHVAAPIAPEVKVQWDKQIETARAEASHYHRLYQAAIKDAAGLDKLVETIQNVGKAIPEVPLLVKHEHCVAESSQVAVAPICDTHIGEKVDFAQMGGFNEYDIDIFNARLRGWADKVVSLVGLRQKYAHVPDLVVPLLGDLVSGDIQPDNVRTNLDNSMNQMVRGAHMIAQALMFVSQYFENVSVPCVVGNHGRMTVKPPAKDIYVSWDYLAAQWIAAFCKKQPNIHFSIPRSFMHVFDAAGHKILILHGDSIKGGFAGIPYYGITRAVAQLRQAMQFRRGLEEDLQRVLEQKKPAGEILTVFADYFDSVLLGHFHVHNEIDIGTGEAVVCGSFMGGDEYSLGKLHTLSAPKQVLLFFHPKYGYISRDIIYLQHFNKDSAKFDDVLPDVWAEKI